MRSESTCKIKNISNLFELFGNCRQASWISPSRAKRQFSYFWDEQHAKEIKKIRSKRRRAKKDKRDLAQKEAAQEGMGKFFKISNPSIDLTGRKNYNGEDKSLLLVPGQSGGGRNRKIQKSNKK